MERRYRLAAIRLLVLDVDGTLTDGAMYYGAKGEVLKRFYAHDGYGIVGLLRHGIDVAFLTSESSPFAAARARKLGVRHVCLGAKDKLPSLRRLCERLDVPLSGAAYMGDDLNDAECLRSVGFSACPADAVPEIRRGAAYVCRKPGGRGAVREVCDLLLRAQGALTGPGRNHAGL